MVSGIEDLPNPDGYKKKVRICAAGSHTVYDSQATNRKQGGLPMRAPLPPSALLLVAWLSYMTPS
jgi:hypothetical protein